LVFQPDAIQRDVRVNKKQLILIILISILCISGCSTIHVGGSGSVGGVSGSGEVSIPISRDN